MMIWPILKFRKWVRYSDCTFVVYSHLMKKKMIMIYSRPKNKNEKNNDIKNDNNNKKKKKHDDDINLFNCNL